MSPLLFLFVVVTLLYLLLIDTIGDGFKRNIKMSTIIQLIHLLIFISHLNLYLHCEKFHLIQSY